MPVSANYGLAIGTEGLDFPRSIADISACLMDVRTFLESPGGKLVSAVLSVSIDQEFNGMRLALKGGTVQDQITVGEHSGRVDVLLVMLRGLGLEEKLQERIEGVAKDDDTTKTPSVR